MPTEESPAQRAARLRREKREANIKASGTARLDKITSLSGRTPSSLRDESLSSNNTPSPPSERQQPTSPLENLPTFEEQSPQNTQAQEEYIRALLRSQQPVPPPLDTDPTAKLLTSLFGLPVPSPPGVVTPGGTNTAAPPNTQAPELWPNDLTSALGAPPFLAKLIHHFIHPTPLSPAAKRMNTAWRGIHVAFAFLLSLYLLVTLQSSISIYGTIHPPPPATVQNPFVILVLGELLLAGTRMVLGNHEREGSGNNGAMISLTACTGLLLDIARDGRIMVFVLGISSLFTESLEHKVSFAAIISSNFSENNL
ncbi:hypothetical protein FQN57_002469 [Myotisia sp. PD_48]|nr:hypothetical protein FQN57_002469 [Myotisia sp. PD_48]